MNDPRALATALLARGARLVTIVCTPGETPTLRYFWDLAGALEEHAFAAPMDGIPSIADLTPAADWIEREIHDYFAVPFHGRRETAPLMLRPGDAPGIFTDSTRQEPAR